MSVTRHVAAQPRLTEEFLNCSKLEQENAGLLDEYPPGSIVTALSEVVKIENDFTGCTDKTKAIFLFFQLYCVARE